MIGLTARTLVAGCLTLTIAAGAAKAAPEQIPPVVYRNVKVDGFSIFYRGAGPANAPTLLMLHGFPPSSRTYEPLFARLAGVHVIDAGHFALDEKAGAVAGYICNFCSQHALR